MHVGRLAALVLAGFAPPLLAGCAAGTSRPGPTPIEITGWPSPVETPTGQVTFAACPDAALLATIRAGVPIEGRRWGTVEVLDCRGGYARVFTKPEDAVEGEQELVFLQAAGTGWTVLASGTGLRCGPDGDQEITTACQALGLS